MSNKGIKSPAPAASPAARFAATAARFSARYFFDFRRSIRRRTVDSASGGGIPSVMTFFADDDATSPIEFSVRSTPARSPANACSPARRRPCPA